MLNVYINYSPTPPPPPNRKQIVSSSRRSHSTIVAQPTSSSDRNHSQKVVISERANTDRYFEISPYDRSRGSDNQRVQKVLDKLGGVRSWKVNSDGKLTVSTIQRPETIINALKHEFSSNRRITILQQTNVISSRSNNVSFQDKTLQAMGTMVATHASQGLIKSIEYKETTTKEGTQTRAMKFNYVNRDEGTSTARAAPSVPRVHPTSRPRVGFATTSREMISRSRETSRLYH